MTTVEELKGLYVALGGNAEAVADMALIPELIHAIAALVSANKAPAKRK